MICSDQCRFIPSLVLSHSMKWSSAGKVEVEILDDEERGSAEGRLIIMAGQVVNVICTHKAEVRIHVKKLTRYLEKQAHDKQTVLLHAVSKGLQA